MTSVLANPDHAPPRAPARPLGLLVPMTSPWVHRRLLANLAGREVAQRYRGSVLGVLWALAGPLLQLLVYAVVFGWLLGPRLGEADRAAYVIYLFCGIVVFGIFAEVTGRAPMLVLEKQALITKVAFPLELTPLVALWGALVPAGLGLVLLLGAVLWWQGSVPWTAVLLIVPLVPLSMLTVGLAWILAAVGVYIRDAQHAVRAGVQLWFFLTPVVWPLSLAPEGVRWLVMLNPLAWAVEWSRDVLIRGELPGLMPLLVVTGASAAVLLIGAWCFQTLRRGFADVV